MRPMIPLIGASGSALNEVGEPPRPTAGTNRAEVAADRAAKAAPLTTLDATAIARPSPRAPTRGAAMKPVTAAAAVLA